MGESLDFLYTEVPHVFIKIGSVIMPLGDDFILTRFEADVP
jgi:hypothetical protein